MSNLTKLGLLFLFLDGHDFLGHRILASEPFTAMGGILSQKYLRIVVTR